MTSRTKPGTALPEPPRNAMDGVDEDAALLVDLLKLATFVSNPMRTGVAEPLDLAPTDLRIILALGGEGELAGHELSDIMGVPPMKGETEKSGAMSAPATAASPTPSPKAIGIIRSARMP